MKKLIKWLLGIVAFVAMLLILAVILLPIFFDPNEHKPQIQQAASDSIGREVVLNGPIEWSVFPWVAINLTDVTVANEAGFKGDYLAQVDQVAVRVQLLPLLKKQIKIGEVVLQKPSINLQVAQSGKSNWQSILDNSAAAEAESDNSKTDLEIRGISISQGNLNYIEGDLRVEMSDLSFSSGAIKDDASTAMDLTAVISIPSSSLQGNLKTSWLASHLTNGPGPVFEFNDLAFDGKLDAVSLKLNTSGQSALDLAKDTLSVSQLELQYGVMSLSTPLNGQQLTKNMALSGKLSVDEFSLADLLAEMGSPLDNQAGNKLSGTATWSLVGDRFQLNDLDFNLDDSELKGDVDLKQMSLLKGQFNLAINQLNLDDYLPQSEASSSTAAKDSSAMDLGQLSGQVKIGQLQAAGVKLTDINLDIRTQGEDIIVNPLQAGFYQGLIKTELKLQPNSQAEKLSLTHQMQDFQAGNLLTDLMGTDYLTGLGQLNADIKIDEPFSERPLKTANGTLSYKLTDGDIVGIDVFQIMEQSLSLLNKSDAVKNSDELKTAFGLMEIQAQVTNGVLKTQTLKLTSPFFDLNGQVEIDLDQQTIVGTIKPMLTNIPEGVLNKNFEKLLNIRIPVSLKGNLLAPDISIDVAKLILESQKSKIDEKKEELKEDLFDALLGNKKDQKGKPSESNSSNEQATEEGEEAPVELTEKQKKKAEKDQMKRDLLEGLLGGNKDKKKSADENEDDGGN